MPPADTGCDVTILVVSYNTREFTVACLESVYAETRNCSFEVIVVDNASTDGSAEAIAERAPQAKCIASERNLGFAAANNLAARDAQCRYLLLLNPDTVVQNGAIDTLVAFADARPDHAIFGGRTVYGDGRLNPTSCWRAPSLSGLACRALALDVAFAGSEFFNRDCYGAWPRDTEREIDIVSGCFLLIRREVWEELGGFDSDFFMYAEDWDLCMRAKAAGHRALLCPQAEIVHYGGASERVLEDKITRLLETKARLCRKHWSPMAASFGVALLDLWVIVRLAGYRALSLVRRTKRDSYARWQRVWSNRRRWHENVS